MGKIWFHGVRIDHEPEFVMERDLNKDNYHHWLNKFEAVLCDWSERILGVQIESIKDIPDQMTEGEQEACAIPTCWTSGTSCGIGRLFWSIYHENERTDGLFP